ncbi:hypothetical protein BDN72DRAFT_845109 [Pluteus cervinus]|uniref:Uncharacterized protein n=1 Tax=Pluteus cervinus TaxID=181527 RepID=A0ACD3AJV2_9AGAR|nr:hypothetical protein BDN72DRAFT_845109 [Pluteus cervinus]
MDLFPVEKRKKIIDGARKGSLRDLIVLSKIWQTLPNPLSDGIPSIFFHHLNSSEVPTEPESDFDLDDVQVSMASDTLKAFWSLSAITHLTGLLSSLATDPYGHEIVQAWPGIFKWSAFLFTSRVQICSTDHITDTASAKKLASMRGVVRDAIAGAWCAIATSESARKVMLKTHGVVEIAARLWIFEDDPEVTKVTSIAGGVPVASLLLEHLSNDSDKAAMDHIISAAGGDLEEIAKTSLNRFKNALNAPEFESDPLDSILTFNLVVRFCRTTPRIGETFIKNGAILDCIELLIRVAFVLNERNPEGDDKADFIQLMIMGFWFLRYFLDTTTGTPWVLQAINAGLLTAFVECSPVYYDLKRDDYLIASTTITHTIPRYLAYYCIVQAMDSALSKLEKTERFLSLRKTRAWKAFDALALLTARRLVVNDHWFKFLKKNASTCDNPKCQKLDSRENFRKCGKCGSVLYCSKECQAIHWKEFGHKRKCKQPAKIKLDIDQRYRADGGIPQRDFDYIQSLNVCETRYNLPHLKHLAATEYPGVPLNDLMVLINYNEVPTAYDLVLHREYAEKMPKVYDPPKNLYRPDLEAASYTYIVGSVPFGKEPKMMVSRFPSGIWDLDKNPFKNGEEARVDPTGSRLVDWMDKEAEAKRKQYCGV